MKQSPQSLNLQALVPIENYHIVLNERSRFRQHTTQVQHQQVKALKSSIIRRKSCYCSCCGEMNDFQYNMMNLPLQRVQIQQPYVTPPQHQVEAPSQPLQRRSLFYRLQSLKSPEKDNVKLSLEIHGFGDKLKRQSTLQQMILEGYERQQRVSVNCSATNSLHSENDNHSIRSLQFVFGTRVNTEQSPILTPSLKQETGTPKNIKTQRKINKLNVYFSSSQKSIKNNKSAFQPIRRPPQLILPKIKTKGEQQGVQFKEILNFG